MIRLTLVSRLYCHLCHDMEEALRPLIAEFGVALDVFDVDADPQLESLYDELVPVLLHGDMELCHYVLESEKLAAYLQSLRTPAAGQSSPPGGA